jgi:Domain of Unknown Function with PDB structure (DUF3857)
VRHKLLASCKHVRFASAGAVVLITSCYCCNVLAEEFKPDATVLNDDIVLNVNADGSSTTDRTESIRIDTEKGIREQGQIALRYSTLLQDLDVVTAYTTTRDGQRIDVTPDEIRTQQSAESAGAPMFDDSRVKTIIFPGLEVGATVTFVTHKRQRKALFPGLARERVPRKLTAQERAQYLPATLDKQAPVCP